MTIPSPRCMYCDKPIVFSDEHLSAKGRFIPQDVDLGGEIIGNHDCPERQQQYYINKQKTAKEYKCFKCGDTIIFDQKYRSKNDRPVPMDPNTAQPHACIQR